MSVDDSSYYPYKQPGSIPFNWEIRPGVPKHYHNLRSPPLPQHTTRPVKLRPPPPPPVSSLVYPFEEPRTRSFISAPRTRSILSSSPRTHSYSQRIVSSPKPGPEVVGPGCFPSPSKQDRMSGGRWGKRRSSRGRSKRVESEFGFDFGPDYGSDLEMLVRWSTSISAMRKSNAAFQNSLSDDSSPSSCSSNSPVSHAEWAALNLF